MKHKLTAEDKIEISISGDKSLRELALKYGVHHSTIDEIRKNASELLKEYWEEKSKKIGRPRKEVNIDPEKQALIEKLKATQKELALQNMKMDYLELQIKWQKEDLEEAKIKRKKHLKKK